MPELPEVEILVRHLRPLLRGKLVRKVRVFRPKILRPTPEAALRRSICGRRFKTLQRRGKYLLFELSEAKAGQALTLLGHLGMTGRLYLAPVSNALPKHAAVVFELGRHNLIFEDTRYFGRLTLETGTIRKLGPEPLSPEFTTAVFAKKLLHSRQAIKVKLLDQSVVAGVGNIYASEALFRAGIPPTLPACKLSRPQVRRLHQAIRQVLTEAIERGSTIPLNYSGAGGSNGLFYFGLAPDGAGARGDFYEERLRVYDKADQPCPKCGTAIQRIVQAARSTFYCPQCQPEQQPHLPSGLECSLPDEVP